MQMKLWVDADAAPREVKELVFRAARRLSLDTVLVANRRLPLPLDARTVSAVQVPGGPDAADAYIAAHAAPGDLAITADIPLASILVGQGVRVLTPGGEELTTENVGERLALRDWMEGLRGAGVEAGGSRPWSARDRQTFAAALDRVLTRLLRS
jgi:uncharacterized protein YaiI (UPF0178 family)